jgi:hypothetical protein
MCFNFHGALASFEHITVSEVREEKLFGGVDTEG